MKIHKYDEEENEREVKCGQKQRRIEKKKARQGLVISDLYPVEEHVPPVECLPLLREFRIVHLSSGFPKSPTLVSL